MSAIPPLGELAKDLGPGGIAAGAELRAYARDCWPQALGWSEEQVAAHVPAAALRPAGEEGVAAALAWASRRGVALVPRGAGSGVLGAAVPSAGAVVLDASRLTAFELRAQSPEPVVRAGAGWRGGDLERRLNALGWSLMNFPQSLEDSTAGGWIATDAFGQLSTRYGGVRAQVRGVRAAGLDGAVRAEAPGPHLGAEGTLGALTEVTLRVRPDPASRRFYAYEFPGLEPALGWAREAMAAGNGPPSVLRLYGPADAFFNGLKRSGAGGSSGALRSRVEALLLKRTDWLNALTPLLGARWLAAAVYEDEAPFEGAAPPPAPAAADLGEGPARRWWERRYHLSKERLERTFAAGGFVDTADFWAPLALMPRLDADVRAALRPHALSFSHLSHFDGTGACLYVTFAGSGGGERHARAWSAALAAGVAAGARVNHHHGIGLGKLAWRASAWDEARFAAWRAEKSARDPRGLLNPGKICP